METKRDIRILFLEEAPTDVVLVNHELRKAGLSFRSKRADSREAYLEELQHDPPDLILADHGSPSFDGLTALEVAKKECPEVPFIYVTNARGEEEIIQAYENGAAGCVLKSRLSRVVPVVRRALREAEWRALLKQKVNALGEDGEGLLDLPAGAMRDRENESTRFAQITKEAPPQSETDETLRKSEALKTAILETALDAIISIDHQGLIQEWNPAAQRLFGYARSEALGRPMDALIVSPALRETYQDGLANYLMTGAGSLLGRPVEMTLRRADGSEFKAEVSITRVPTEEPPRCTALIRDITARKHAEDLIWELNRQLERRVLERSAQLEAANDELEAFSYSVAHDLQAPLHHVLGYVDILQHEAAASLNPESQEHLNTIAAAARRLEHLINALMAFSRLGRAELREQRVSLASLVEGARSCLRHESEGRQIAWQIGDLPEVDGDPIMLRQVILNLLSNALKYTRPRSEAKIEIGALDGKQETVVSIRDNGVGFDTNHADKLFGVFQRLHPAGEFEGTGIGLANVRRIIWRHGGRVWADSTIDGGATFYFSLPKLQTAKPV